MIPFELVRLALICSPFSLLGLGVLYVIVHRAWTQHAKVCLRCRDLGFLPALVSPCMLAKETAADAAEAEKE